MAARPSPSRRVSLPLLEGPEDARLQTWLGLVRAMDRMIRRVEQTLGELDVTLPQFDVLATLRTAEGVTQQQLAERLVVTKGNVCGVLDRLESLRWVERRPDPADRRANRVYLTPAGRQKITRMLPAHYRQILRGMQSLSDADVKTLRKLAALLDKSAAEM